MDERLIFQEVELLCISHVLNKYFRSRDSEYRHSFEFLLSRRSNSSFPAQEKCIIPGEISRSLVSNCPCWAPSFNQSLDSDYFLCS